MTEQLQGRALDEAVARAMGWTEIRREIIHRFRGGDDRECLVGNPPDGSSPAPLIRHIPAYRDNPNAQEEMLEWLRKHTGSDGKPDLSRLMIQWHHSNLADNSLMFGFQASVCRDGAWFAAFGATINEALARLVLAVAGRDAK